MNIYTTPFCSLVFPHRNQTFLVIRFFVFYYQKMSDDRSLLVTYIEEIYEILFGNFAVGVTLGVSHGFVEQREKWYNFLSSVRSNEPNLPDLKTLLDEHDTLMCRYIHHNMNSVWRMRGGPENPLLEYFDRLCTYSYPHTGFPNISEKSTRINELWKSVREIMYRREAERPPLVKMFGDLSLLRNK